MGVAICLFVYATGAAIFAPPLLRGLTADGAAPRLGVAAWLAVLVSVLGSWSVAIVFALGAVAVRVWHHPRVLVILGAGRSQGVATVVTAVVLVGAVAVAAVQLARLFRAMRARAHEHAEALRLLGRPLGHYRSGAEGFDPGVVVLAAAEPAAYCLAGRPDVIVITSGAVDALGDRELAAVLAHERAHLTGRHPQILTLLRGLAATFPRLAVCRDGAREVGRLCEMWADDGAIRHHGRAALLSGLLAMSGIATET